MSTEHRPQYEGARYGRADPHAEPPEPSVDATECQNCDDPVSTDYRRIFGDRDDICWHCSECTTMSDMLHGAGARPDYAPRVPGHHARGGDD